MLISFRSRPVFLGLSGTAICPRATETSDITLPGRNSSPPGVLHTGRNAGSGLLPRLLWGARVTLTGLLLSGVGLLLLPWAAWLIARLSGLCLSWLVCHVIAS